MRTTVFFVLAFAGLSLTSVDASAQSITVTATNNPNPPVPPPAGQQHVDIAGDYTLAAGTQFDYVLLEYYTANANGGWDLWVTARNGGLPGNKYAGSVTLPAKTSCMVIAKLFVRNNANPVANAVAFITTPP